MHLLLVALALLSTTAVAGPEWGEADTGTLLVTNDYILTLDHNDRGTSGNSIVRARWKNSLNNAWDYEADSGPVPGWCDDEIDSIRYMTAFANRLLIVGATFCEDNRAHLLELRTGKVIKKIELWGNIGPCGTRANILVFAVCDGTWQTGIWLDAVHVFSLKTGESINSVFPADSDVCEDDSGFATSLDFAMVRGYLIWAHQCDRTGVGRSGNSIIQAFHIGTGNEEWRRDYDQLLPDLRIHAGLIELGSGLGHLRSLTGEEISI